MNETQLVYEQMRCKIVKLEQENKVLAQNLEDTEIVNKALEKENAELRNNGFTVSAMTEQQLKVALEKGEQLEKENAELKETVIKMNKVITETFSNLTKAKELLEKLLITSCNSDVLGLLPNCSEALKVRVEAEQFLIEPNDRFEVTEKGKKYLSSH